MRIAIRILVCATLTALCLVLPRSLASDEDEKKRKEERKQIVAALDERFGKDADVIARKKVNAKLTAFLKSTESMEVFRLDPKGIDEADEGKKDSFHGYEILARAKVEKLDQRAEVATSLGKSLHWADDWLQALCFRPRHGMRVVHGKLTVDIVICFECQRMKVRVDADGFEQMSKAEQLTVVERMARIGWLRTMTVLETEWEPAEKLLLAAEKKAKRLSKP